MRLRLLLRITGFNSKGGFTEARTTFMYLRGKFFLFVKSRTSTLVQQRKIAWTKERPKNYCNRLLQKDLKHCKAIALRLLC